MVGVRGVSGGLAGGRTRPTGSGRGSFSLGGVRAHAAAGTQGAVPAQPLGLLALQESGPAAERDARARQQADALLLSLRELQIGVLEGALDQAALHRLAALPTGAEAADPALAAVLTAIRLRARVELARHGLDPAASSD
ncbi:hypothetical protein GXW78_15160 [Roseomonas terrae]|jgi:hypothetical protein|uniref:Flagellar assembly regulator FliX n=1 Tax=Neoroseomonas terrae TaxID=424799 RepID=A0ABS5EJ06_9PROT|nr:flagellar assembly protein FliX [Neoroseomonas terrae]MBR0651011.1 hypothetical protein [Neoroseomonas terrae]